MTARLLVLPLLLAGAARAETGRIAGVVSVEQADGAPRRDRSGVVVYLEGVPPGAAARPPSDERPRIRQKDQQFTPRLTVISRGTTVEFPNEDKIFHNVFSVSDSARFDLGLYKSGESKAVTFKRAGTVDVYCNIHPNMVARVKVVDSPFFTTTAADGSFELRDVPAGSYTLVAWPARGKEERRAVTVAPGPATRLELRVVEGKAPATHLRKDGTPYGRYK
jgi:plastocyanin